MATQEEIFEAVKQHLESRGIDGAKIARESDLLTDLDLDSLDTMEFTLAMEERFSIEIPDGDLESLRTVNDAIALVERKLAVSA